MLNTLRRLDESRKKESKLIKEQEELYRDPNPEEEEYKSSFPDKEVPPTSQPQGGGAMSFQQGREETAFSGNGGEESSDFIVINDVEVVIHSEDPEDLQLNDEEKGKISQLIDDFRAEVDETVEFGKMDIYEASGKLTGKIGEFGMEFTLSTGDDTGLYLNGQMLKIDENSLSTIEKLNQYQMKYSSTINDLLVRRKTT
jgi:hypothetical protein